MTKMLSVRDAAEILGVSEWVINQLLSKRELEGYKIKGTWKITQAQIDKYLDSVRNTNDE